MYLLDTNALLYFLYDSEKLSKRASDIIYHSDEQISVSIVSMWEIGTIPMYRDFGLDREFLDMPIPEAEVRMIAPIREAVQEWEPRATVKDVFFTRSGDGSGRLLAHVEIEINELGNG